MAKVINLFGEEEINKASGEKEQTPLPLIPLANKKASKNDTPLEKEIRRFNKLVKDLHEFEENEAKQKEYDELYEQLYQQQVLPHLKKLSHVKYRFVQHIHELFNGGKFTKTEQKYFTDFVLGILQDAIEFVPEARDLIREYLNKQVRLMNKREKDQFSGMMEREGFKKTDLSDFDVEDMWQQKKEKVEKEFFQEHEEFFHEQKDAHRQQKKEVYKHQDINTLYKELVKLLHPDLEQNEDLRHQKEHLMKDLVKARHSQDLHAMLLIKAKAKQFQSQEASAAENAYSLEQLKRYNKELRSKLNDYKAGFTMNLINSMTFGSNGFITGFGRHKNPEEEIKQEVKDIKKEIKAVEADIKSVQTVEDIKDLIEMHRTLPDDFF